MTVPNTTNRVVYAGAGSVGPFAVNFNFILDADLVLIKTLIAAPYTETTLVLTADYTVVGAGVPGGGSVTLVAALPVTHKLTIYRNPDALQGIDLGPNDDLPADSIERGLDKLTMLIQRMQDQYSRTLRLSDGDISGVVTQLPVAGLAGQVLGMNAAANGYQWINAIDINAMTLIIGPSIQADMMPIYNVAGAVQGKIALQTLANGGRGFLFGGKVSNNAGDPTNDLDFAAMRGISDNNVSPVSVLALTKQTDALFAVGTNAGCMDVLAGANATIHFFAIRRDSDGLGDILGSTSLAPAVPVGWSGSRRICSIPREAGVMVGIVQKGDKFLRKASIASVDVTNPGVAAVLRAMKVPTGIQVDHIGNWQLENAAAGVVAGALITSPDQNDEAPSLTVTPYLNLGGAVASSAGNSNRVHAELITRTDTSAQVRTRLILSDANCKLRCATIGWIDDRNRITV